MLRKLVTVFGGDPHKKKIEALRGLVEEINALEPSFESLSDEALRAKTDEFRARIADAVEGIEDPDERFDAEQDVLDEILPEAFAVVREASKRTIGLRHYDVQLIGGIVMHRGTIAEMKTGEGKTLVATLPLYLNALTGKGVHLVTVNDYLARRDARWMGPIYHFLGLSVGILQMAAATENGKKAFLYDPSRESTHEDQHNLRMVPRAEAYAADITYGTNNEFGFDYLRDNMAMRLEDRVQRGHYYAIIDEVDNVLIDEARTPLIISGPASGNLEWYSRMAQLVKQLKPEDYEINERDRSIALTEIGIAHVEELLGQPLSDPERPEDVTPEQARLMGYLEQALRAQYLFKRNKDYLVQGGKVVIVDEFTGRLMPGRRWSDGLHQAVEAKEGVKIEPENITYATITLQNYFRMYEKLSGMTGTAVTEAEEFDEIYGLDVLPIPMNLEYQAMGPNAVYEARKAKEEDTGYEYTYYVRRGAPPDAAPELWKRKDYPDSIYRTKEAKLRAIVKEIIRFHAQGRPLLIGTTSVESSEELSGRLRAEPVRRLLQTMLIRRRWLDANDREEDGRVIEELIPLNEPLEKLSPSMLRKFARPLGMASINPADEANLPVLMDILNLAPEHMERLKAIVQGGVPNQVLNARKHTEESQIIAGAGAFGAVTIATNMAGRGVDIKLGGELAEEVVASVNRVLRKNGYRDPYDMPLEERRQALLKMDSSQYGIYETEVRFFLQYFEEMEHVKAVGGLHVIGAERYEARRIDNQLRGRAARQGDPGSSRFFLSLEDDLMRLFGGEQVSNLMQRLKVDDSLPLENRLVANIIEQSQERVEGANFDVRKHLLEYDDVLNAQREQVYAQRDRVFTKENLSEDIDEMLYAEVQRRVESAFAEEESLWRLLAWLEGVQPSFPYGEEIYPSFTYRILLDELKEGDIRETIPALIRRALLAEHEHILYTIDSIIERTSVALEEQIRERFDILDTFLEVQSNFEEICRPQEILGELIALVRVPLRLDSASLRLLAEDPYEIEENLREAIERYLSSLNLTRLLGAVERRLGESLNLDKNDLASWEEGSQIIFDAAQDLMERQRERLTGENGQILRELDSALKQNQAAAGSEAEKIRLLMGLAQGARAAFDSRTHRQIRIAYTRVDYVYLAAQLLADEDADSLLDDVMDHLEGARDALRRAWGEMEWNQRLQSAKTLSEFGTAAAFLFESNGGAHSPEDAPAALSEAERDALIEALGEYHLNETYRQLLLSAITELWVDYLTRVEALRVSIGLEAYAQRDPLVQYKSRASEMFQELMADIRSQVISRIFAYQPRRFRAEPFAAAESLPAAVAPASEPKKKGRRRHKKRKRH